MLYYKDFADYYWFLSNLEVPERVDQNIQIYI